MTIQGNRSGLICALVVGIVASGIVLGGCVGTPKTFGSVQLTPSGTATVGQGQALGIAAMVLNDTAGAGVTWTLSGPGALSSVTATGVVYTAPTPVSSATTATVTATSVTFPTKAASLTITIQPPPAITTTSLPAASINAAYSATVDEIGGVPPFTWSIVSAPAWLSLAASTTSSVNLAGTPAPSDQGTFPVAILVTDATGAAAPSSGLTVTVTDLAITTTSPLPSGVVGTPYSVQFAATGGTSPYTWSLASGTTPPAGLALSSSGLLSGTPTAAASGATIGVTVTDSESPTISITVNFTLTISSAQNLSLLTGNYAFEFSGFNSGGAVVAGGSFTADGQGNIKNGVEDFNSIAGTPVNQIFTGTYTVGSDGRGTLTFSSLSGSPAYDFAVDATGAHGRMIEADSTGVHGSGQLELQSVSTCGSSTIGGEYAFGASGYSSAPTGFTAGPVSMAGRFTATAGSLGNGEMDANAPGRGLVQEPLNGLSGTYQTTSQAARCTATLMPSSLPDMKFSVYPVSSSEAFLVETDTASGNSTSTPFLTVGMLRQQVGYPFTGLSGGLTATSVGALSGQFLSGSSYVSDDAVVSITAGGVANFGISFTENRGGTVTTVSNTGTFINADQFGRLASQGLDSEIAPVFYTISANEAFCVGGVIGNPFFGVLEPQTAGPFNAATIKATLAEGTLAPSVSAVPDVSGVLAFDGVSNVNGTEDTKAAPNLTVTGTYKLTSTGSTDGSGTMTLTSPAAFTGAFYIVSPTKIVMVSTTSGDTNPVLIVIGQD
ncbi:MAG TPA: putative Ig domain-containing protein [Candidatus Acidoferrales bacterium]|nr:putative Ig domain-containing protein [Candidatus Acidoferrales bacterium]